MNRTSFFLLPPSQPATPDPTTITEILETPEALPISNSTSLATLSDLSLDWTFTSPKLSLPVRY